jgi:hypothetical protein
MYQCRDRNDKPKKSYASEKSAQSVADYEQLERGVDLSVYKCTHSRHWHLTSKQ